MTDRPTVEAIVRATLAQTHFAPRPHNLGWIGDKWGAVVDDIIADAVATLEADRPTPEDVIAEGSPWHSLTIECDAALHSGELAPELVAEGYTRSDVMCSRCNDAGRLVLSEVTGAVLFAGAVEDIIRNCRNNLDHYQGVNEGPARRSARASAYLQISDLYEETFGRIDQGWEFR